MFAGIFSGPILKKEGRINQTNSMAHKAIIQAVNFRSQGFFWTVPMAIALDVAT
jgi:hypothetical protein